MDINAIRNLLDVSENLQNLLEDRLEYSPSLYTQVLASISGMDYDDIVSYYNTENLNNIDEEEFESVKVVLNNDDFYKLNYKEYLFVEEPKEKRCSICLDDFNDKDLVYLLECKHLFHKICIDEWLTKYNYNCPICRKKLGKGEPIIE